MSTGGHLRSPAKRRGAYLRPMGKAKGFCAMKRYLVSDSFQAGLLVAIARRGG